jgi:hypothetical protein
MKSLTCDTEGALGCFLDNFLDSKLEILALRMKSNYNDLGA